MQRWGIKTVAEGMLHASNLSRNVAKSRGSFYVSCSSHRNNCSCKMGCYTWIFSCNLQHNKRCVAGSKKNCFECATWPLINFQMFLWTAKTMNVNLPNCSQGLRLTVANKTQTKKKFHFASGFCASLAILWALEALRRPIKSKLQIFRKLSQIEIEIESKRAEFKTLATIYIRRDLLAQAKTFIYWNVKEWLTFFVCLFL